MNKYSSVRNLIFSILIDLVGMATYFVPGVGETFDLIWAPISGILIYLIYHQGISATVGAVEEILPFTDFVPTATVMWVYNKANNR